MSDSDSRPALRVVAGILSSAASEILLAQRPAAGPHADQWEFPGGKIEPGETIEHALARELDEELGVEIAGVKPFRTVQWTYHDRAIELIACRVASFTGTPENRAHQALRWTAPRVLLGLAMPAADRPIAVALNLPDVCLVTPEPGEGFLERIEGALVAGVRAVQLRAKSVDAATLRTLARDVRRLTRRHGAIALLNGHATLAVELGYDGVHLPAADIASMAARPVPTAMLLGASCHDASECAKAFAAGADYLVLAPVLETASKPGAAPLGWARFEQLAKATPLPCYALGGVRPDDLDIARAHGAHGIAAISALWAR